MIPIIEDEVRDAKYVAKEIPFNNLNPLANDTLASINPDIFYGARFKQLDRHIREKLNNRIILSTESTLPILSNFFTEVKGPDGFLAVTGR